MNENNFYNFLEYIDKSKYYKNENMNDIYKSEWNKKRTNFLKEFENNKSLFESEISELNAKNFYEIIPKELTYKDYYQNIFKEIIKNIIKNNKILLSNETINYLINIKEKYEIKKNIINKYLEYIFEKEFNLLSKSFNNSIKIYNNVNDSLCIIKNYKFIFNKLKKSYVINSKILLKKQKYNHCKLILNYFLQLKNWKNKLDNINNSYNNKENNFSKINLLIKEISSSNLNKKSLICFGFINELQKIKNNYLENFEEKLSLIFQNNIKPSEFNDLFEIFKLYKISKNENEKNTIQKFFTTIIEIFKKHLFKIIKGISLIYCSNCNTINPKNIYKIDNLNILNFTEKNLYYFFNEIIINFTKICNNIQIYMNYNSDIGKLFKNNKNIFIDNLTLNIIKLFDIYNIFIYNFNDKNIRFKIISILYLFGIYLLNSFKIQNLEDYKNKLNKIFKNLCFLDMIYNIKKLYQILCSENWKKIPVNNIENLINSYNNQIINYGEYISLFNDYNINNINNETIIEKIKNLDNNKEQKKLFEIFGNKIFNKSIHLEKLIFNNSCINAINFILELYTYKLYLKNIEKDVYDYIYTIYDYYIYSCLNIFVDKKYIEKLYINYIQVIPDNYHYIELLKIDKEANYFKNIFNLIQFMRKTKKNLKEKIFPNINIEKITPILSDKIYKDKNNLYNLLIEKIICFESINTIFKIIKRISPKNNLQIIFYKNLLNEISFFLYYPICKQIFKIDKILFTELEKINYNKNNSNEGNDYIYLIIEEINKFYNNLDLISNNCFTEKSKKKFFNIIINYIFETIKKNLIKIKITNKNSFNNFINDIKILKENLDNIVCDKKIIKIDFQFGKLLILLNNINNNKKEILSFYKEKEISLRDITNVIKINYILTKQEKNNMTDELKQICFQNIQKINIILDKM